MTIWEKRVIDYAIKLWRNQRPATWIESEHLRNPAVNTLTYAGEDLARAVASLLCERYERRNAKKRRLRRDGV